MVINPVIAGIIDFIILIVALIRFITALSMILHYDDTEWVLGLVDLVAYLLIFFHVLSVFIQLVQSVN